MADRVKLPMSGGVSAWINADDFERELWCEFHDGFRWVGRICDRTWQAVPNGHTTYGRCIIRTAGRKLRDMRLHRLVMCASAGIVVDHIDHDGLNCVRDNLRCVTTRQNCLNRFGARESSSRFKGVSRHRNKWQAQIKVQAQTRYLGLFAAEDDAARAYDAAAMTLFGEYAALNFPAA